MSRDRFESFKEFTRQNLLHAWPDRSETSFFSFFFSLIANDIVYIYTTNSNRGKARKRSQLIIHHFEQTICKTFAYNFFLHFLSFLQYPVVGIAIRNRFSGWHSASAYNSLSPTGRTSCSPTFYNVHCYFETRVHDPEFPLKFHQNGDTSKLICLSNLSCSLSLDPSLSRNQTLFLFVLSYSILFFLLPASISRYNLASLTVQTRKRASHVPWMKRLGALNDERWKSIDRSSSVGNRSNEWNRGKKIGIWKNERNDRRLEIEEWKWSRGDEDFVSDIVAFNF